VPRPEAIAVAGGPSGRKQGALHILGTPRSSAALIACISLNGYMLIVML
jgi:hypothetical protein